MGDWHDIPHYNFGDGVYRITSPIDPKFPINASHELLNMVYTGDSDNPEAMYGATRAGTTNIGGTVSGLFDVDNGTKLIATAEDGKIYEYSGTDWAVDGTGAQAEGNSTTVGTRWSGSMFYGATTTKNLMVLTNGIDAPLRYDTTNGTVTLGGTPPSLGDFPTPWQGRLWLASKDLLTGSAADNCEQWSVGSGGVNFNVYRGKDGVITGLKAFGNHLFIFKVSSVYRIGPTTNFTAAHIKNVSGVSGCINHQTIAEGEIGDKHVLFWQSEHGIEAITPTDASTGFEPVDVSRYIKPMYDARNITSMNTAWGLFHTRRKEYYGFIPTGTKTVPSLGFIGNGSRSRKPLRWTTINRSNLTSGVIFNDGNNEFNMYVGDNAGKVYKMHDTSTMAWDGAAALRRWQTPYYNQGRPNFMKKYGYLFLSADKAVGATVTQRMVLLRQGLTTHAGNVSDYDVTGSGGWGVGQWGVEPWGGAGEVGKRSRLRRTQRGAGMKAIVESTDWFRIKGINVGSTLRSNKLTS